MTSGTRSGASRLPGKRFKAHHKLSAEPQRRRHISLLQKPRLLFEHRATPVTSAKDKIDEISKLRAPVLIPELSLCEPSLG
jgi:hypothetical protein